MDAPTPPAAPAPPTEPVAPPLTATEAAVVANDFPAFDKADRAARAGKPLPAPEVTPVEEPAPEAAVPEPPKLSKRQQDTNDRIREATERATADLRAENERLRAAAPPVERPRTEAPPAETPVQMAKRYAALPDAPKLADFDTIEEHHAAMALFIEDKRYHERSTEARSRAEYDQEEQRVRASSKGIFEALEARKKTDPEFYDRLDQKLLTELIPASVVPKDLPIGPANIIAEALLRHPATAWDVTEYFNTHRDEYARLTARDPRTGVQRLSQADLLREIGRIEGRLERATSDPPPAPKSVTDAPSPPVVLGSRSAAPVDPVEAAVKADDFATFNRLELERQAGSRLRR